MIVDLEGCDRLADWQTLHAVRYLGVYLAGVLEQEQEQAVTMKHLQVRLYTQSTRRQRTYGKIEFEVLHSPFHFLPCDIHRVSDTPCMESSASLHRI